MKYLVFSLALLGLSTVAVASEAASGKTFRRTLLSLSAGSASISIESGSYSDPGLTLSFGYFFLPKFSLHGHYFATASPSGASNMNGPGLQARYYFYNTETTFELEHRGGKISSYDRYYAYGSLGFLDRQIRTSRTTESFTGFAGSIGGGMKINKSDSLSLDVLQGSLESPAGTTDKEKATFTNISVAYSHLF